LVKSKKSPLREKKREYSRTGKKNTPRGWAKSYTGKKGAENNGLVRGVGGELTTSEGWLRGGAFPHGKKEPYRLGRGSLEGRSVEGMVLPWTKPTSEWDLRAGGKETRTAEKGKLQTGIGTGGFNRGLHRNH